jgi:arylsulfatase A-like enzyme
MNSVQAGGGFAIFKLAASAGLLTGLVEGASFLLFQELGWWHWSMAELAVTAEILWISPLFNLLLFAAMGLMFEAVDSKFPAWPVRRAALALFAFLLCLDWLLASGKIRHSAALILAVGLAATANRLWGKCGEGTYRAASKALPALLGVTLLLLAGVQGMQWYQEKNAVEQLPKATGGPDTPNILVVVIDTLRADHVSAHGYARPTSPVIDRLAREGVMFERAFATSSWTLASHASLLTGRYCFEHGAESEPYDGRFPTIGSELQKHGYRTAAFSANYTWFARKRGLGRGFIRFEDNFSTLEDMAMRTLYARKFKKFVLVPLGYDDWPARKRATQVTDATLRWVEKNADVPFFAFLNYFDVHDPYLPPAPYRTKFATMENPGGRINDYVQRMRPRMTPEQLQGEIDAYDGGLVYVDMEIGRLLGELERRGHLRNTIVVITSDHGEHFGEHGLFIHRNALYREGVHVPLILHWPKKIPAGVRITQPVSNASLPATLLDLLGVVQRDSFVVPSLAPLWEKPESVAAWPLPLMELAQQPYEVVRGWPAYSGRIKSLAAPKWQYIVHEKDGDELYDWENDPKQQRNLAGTPEGQFAVAELRQQMLQILRRREIFEPQNPQVAELKK